MTLATGRRYLARRVGLHAGGQPVYAPLTGPCPGASLPRREVLPRIGMAAAPLHARADNLCGSDSPPRLAQARYAAVRVGLAADGTPVYAVGCTRCRRVNCCGCDEMPDTIRLAIASATCTLADLVMIVDDFALYSCEPPGPDPMPYPCCTHPFLPDDPYYIDSMAQMTAEILLDRCGPTTLTARYDNTLTPGAECLFEPAQAPLLGTVLFHNWWPTIGDPASMMNYDGPCDCTFKFHLHADLTVSCQPAYFRPSTSGKPQLQVRTYVTYEPDPNWTYCQAHIQPDGVTRQDFKAWCGECGYGAGVHVPNYWAVYEPVEDFACDGPTTWQRIYEEGQTCLDLPATITTTAA